MKVNMHEAKSQLSKLGELAWQGESVVIAKAGKPYLDLVPHKEGATERVMGLAKGKIVIHDDFDAADAEIAKLFGMAE
ncbi:Antitoxin component of toxin-antitoxin stability system, DNA-binding transcriptional repressor [Ectothiorhodosinus mongolicus]|uniref:Antitoxin component of toxin-antitoxin stability system, DNA-binding transcriptional repressor n=1 Tax=Ectothiorhodosinus mongolicus TaxID=233100 RepID=A0A1R3VQT5_9GAMM|nr:antitoxin [Ectothiorhodosinus mongolicus]ULX56748.1 type II toxin-antitoxin system prevent-host-death family antitoxin [Ectothiorhodosinus mongolicus]SIT67105.1 Antitoxin component of toxin-antitoxin stability system, DNA-binding transcriptional repressor [Ectothiorhodosinus mongolicus]